MQLALNFELALFLFSMIVPWPNLYWLVSPSLVRRVGRLEHRGYITKYYNQLQTSQDLLEEFAGQHEQYARDRWACLSCEDQAYCKDNSFIMSVVQGTGIAGLRYKSQVKCLHTHLAHYLATGENVVGR